MTADERDDLFAAVKSQIDQLVAIPERADRAVMAAAVLQKIEVALYGARTADAVDEDREDEIIMGLSSADVNDLLQDKVEALEAELARLRACYVDIERNASVAAALKPLRRAGELPWPQ